MCLLYSRCQEEGKSRGKRGDGKLKNHESAKFSPLRPAMFGRTHTGGGGGEEGGGGGAGKEKGRLGERMTEIKVQKEIRSRREGNLMRWVKLSKVRAAGWKVWACGLGVYALITILLPPAPLDEELSLQQWVKEVSKDNV